ncbi:F-box/kelch-repeat protein At5g15710 [Physcomitrium patens]|uniref:F-box domain-containing protein n=1 Tax=Physcomitrium patens TaxID=3218 RepID=A0A2K1ICC1_PHYPA|nr:uncharacterized protein LOC112277904 [Physcomitrium patens]PNR26917.1 hypothetical protein PHYPA_030398 [Physcomitrium patens]|eukprot:XP_024366517.1 uncharacterized protein LOC112277904 [Physcomitrella patens]
MEVVHLDRSLHNVFASREKLQLRVSAQLSRASQDLFGELELDPAIWSSMPDSVLHHVFTKLPVKSLIRVRSLSKFWMSVDFFSNGELDTKQGRFALYKGRPSLSCHKHEAWVFDTPAQEWCKFPVGPFPSPLNFSGPFAAVGGLLCYISDTSPAGTLEVLVGNPVTSTWRLLPPNLNLYEFPTLTQMSVDHDHYSITLVGVCEDMGALVIEIYDSKPNAWHRAEAVPPQTGSCYNLFRGDEFLGLATIDKRSKSVKRLVYPPALQESSFLNRYEDKCWILESRGSLFMCSNAARKEGIWQSLGAEWHKYCALPKELHKYEKTALYLSNEVMVLVGTDPHCFTPQFEDVDPHTITMFNMKTHLWITLPMIESIFGNTDEILPGLMFEPRFDRKP